MENNNVTKTNVDKTSNVNFVKNKIAIYIFDIS